MHLTDSDLRHLSTLLFMSRSEASDRSRIAQRSLPASRSCDAKIQQVNHPQRRHSLPYLLQQVNSLISVYRMREALVHNFASVPLAVPAALKPLQAAPIKSRAVPKAACATPTDYASRSRGRRRRNYKVGSFKKFFQYNLYFRMFPIKLAKQFRDDFL